tara:strand:- start:3663 stop:4475 length:813 start_codon:yes stop_codon:yes gene_type:complete
MVDEQIIKLVENKDRWLITRPGCVEMDSIRDNVPSRLLHTNAGYYNDNSDDRCFEEWVDLYMRPMQKSDMVLIVKEWFDNGYLKRHLVPQFENWNIPHKENVHVYPKNIDTYLTVLETLSKDKKILIIFPFTKSIERNLPHMSEIHPQYNININNISYYQTPQTIQGNRTVGENWLETYEGMVDEIKSLDFDVAFLSCGCYGHPLCGYIYDEMGKSAFYVGGRLQLCFGIMGKRWESENFTNSLTNKYWVRPNFEEIPKNHKNIEGGCYW